MNFGRSALKNYKYSNTFRKKSISLPLDTVTNASAAVSTRKLRTAYAGSAIRVRRASDNAELDIGFDGINLDTGSLLSHCGTSAGYVTTWYDQSGSGNHLTQAVSDSQPRIVSGGIATGNQFTIANSTRFTVTNGADLNPTGDFTLAGWVYLDGVSGVQRIFSKYGGSAGWQLYMNNTGLTFSVGDGSSPVFPTIGSRTSGVWYFCYAQYTSATRTASISVNLGTTQSTSLTNPRTDTLDNLSIGSTTSGTNYLGGRMDSWGMWHRLLTTDERDWLYNSGNGRIYTDLDSTLKTDLKFWYDFDETSGNLLDKQGSNHGTPSANRPTTVTGIAKTQSTIDLAGGKPTITFDGSNDVLGFSGTGLDIARNASGLTIVSIWKAADLGTDQHLLAFSNNSTLTRVRVTKTATTNVDSLGGRTLDGDSFVQLSASTAIGTNYIVTSAVFDYANTDAFLYRNGSQVASSTSYQSAIATSDTASQTGRVGSSPGLNFFLNGTVGELIIYRSVLSTPNRQLLETSQTTYFTVS